MKCRRALQPFKIPTYMGQRLQAQELYLNCRMSSFTSSASPCKMRDKKPIARGTLPRASMPVGARQKSVQHPVSLSRMRSFFNKFAV